jgi:hypothetical protein
MAEPFNKFNAAALAMLKCKHDFENHTFKLYLSNVAPDVANMVNKADLAGIAEGNGYNQAELVVTVNSVAADGGDAVVSATADHVITATSSVDLIPQFRYVVMYNDSDPLDALVGYWDYGSPVELKKANEKFNLGFSSAELLRLSLSSVA